MVIGFIGLGNMASAMVRGIAAAHARSSIISLRLQYPRPALHCSGVFLFTQLARLRCLGRLCRYRFGLAGLVCIALFLLLACANKCLGLGLGLLSVA